MSAALTKPAATGTAVSLGGGDQLLDPPCRGFHVGGSGDIKIDFPDGTTMTFSNVQPGIWPVQARLVYSSGTTATGLVALY